MTITETAIAFVDLLVPGRFEEAKAALDPSCEYRHAGSVLHGNEIILCFEQSHEKAAAQLDRIEYLPGVVDSVVGDTVTVRVSDRIYSKGESHTYTDRLAISLVRSGESGGCAGSSTCPSKPHRELPLTRSHVRGARRHHGNA
jgi:hypothetical protein